MNDAPPELPSPGTVLGWVGKRGVELLVVVVLATVAGEVYLRSHHGRQHDYGPDPDLGARFKPGQETARGRINADGHRGAETDWSKPVIVAVGDSQAFGSGVGDDEVWTTRLAELAGVQVVNAAHPGFGPYQQLVELRRVLDRPGRDVRAVLVRVSIEDRNFLPPKPESLPAIQADTARRAAWREWSRVAPFVVARVRQQYPSLAALARWTSPPTSRPADAKVGEAMWETQGRYWLEMADLAGRAGVPVVFFVHDPTDLPSNGVLEARLREAGANVLRLGSEAWGLRPGTTDQLWEQYHARFTLQHDHHGNALHHAKVAEVLRPHIAAGLPAVFAAK